MGHSKMTARRRRDDGWGKRTEGVSVRLDPKLKYLAELAARKQRRTLSSYIEWAIEQSLSQVHLEEDFNNNTSVAIMTSEDQLDFSLSLLARTRTHSGMRFHAIRCLSIDAQLAFARALIRELPDDEKAVVRAQLAMTLGNGVWTARDNLVGRGKAIRGQGPASRQEVL